MISLIVGRDRNGAIGKGNTIPWHAPEDMKAFQRETQGGALIMGRNTWDSLPVKPLKGRLNIVVSSNPAAAETVVPTVEAAVEMAYAQGYRRIYGIGGYGIYKALMPLAERMLITELEVEVEGADTWFPEFDPAEWLHLGTTALRAEAPACTLHEYLRRTA